MFSFVVHVFGLKELEANKKVPERLGAAAAGETQQRPLGQVAGQQQRAEDEVHVQTQLLQDGLRLQV